MLWWLFNHSPIVITYKLFTFTGMAGALLLSAVLFVGSAKAYFPADFIKLLEGNSNSVRHLRTSSESYNPFPSGYRSQRNRTQPASLRVHSTESYEKNLRETRQVTRANWLGSRSNQLMDICTQLFPNASLRCFGRNRRLSQMQSLPITVDTVY